PALSLLRARWVLRQFTQQARHETFRQGAAPDHPQPGARRRLGLVLRGRAVHRARPTGAGKPRMTTDGPWPRLLQSEWADTRDTLHLWTQIVGKVRLALAPPVNHWWHVPLYASARGLTTSAMPYRDRSIEITFDFLDHALRIETS